MADGNVVLEGQLKYRDGKKWKSRWCIIRKLSPVADRLHLYLYKDASEKCRSESAKVQLALQEFYGIESGFVLDKEHHVMAVLCYKEPIVLAFNSRETLIEWEIRIRSHLGEEQTFPVKLVKCPSSSRIGTGHVRLYIQGCKLCITAAVPPKLLAAWSISDLRKFGLLDGKFCFEAGSRCGKCAGAYVFVTEHGAQITELLQQISQGRVARHRRHSTNRRPQSSRYSMVTSPTGPPSTHAKDFTDSQVYADINFRREEIPRSRTSSSVQPSSSTEYSNSPDNPALQRTQSLGARNSPLRRFRSLTIKSERLIKARSSSDSPDPNRRKGSPKKTPQKQEQREDKIQGNSPEEVVSNIQKSVDALSPKLCNKRKSNSTGSSPADSPALQRRNSQTCVFASHGQATRNSLELLDEALKNCDVAGFSSSSPSSGTSVKELTVNQIRSSICSVGSIPASQDKNTDPMKSKIEYIMSCSPPVKSNGLPSDNNAPALPQKTKTRRNSDAGKNSSKPLEYVDLSRFDGHGIDNASCWVKTMPVHSKSSNSLRTDATNMQNIARSQEGTIHNSLKRTKSCIAAVSAALSTNRSHEVQSGVKHLARRRQSLESFLEEPSVSTVTIPCDISVPKLQPSEDNPYCSLPPKTVKRPGNNVQLLHGNVAPPQGNNGQLAPGNSVQLHSVPPVSCAVFVSSSSNTQASPSSSLVTPISTTTEYLHMSGATTPKSSQPKQQSNGSNDSGNNSHLKSSDSEYIHMSHHPPATKASSMPPYVNIAAYLELIQNIIRPKASDHVQYKTPAKVRPKTPDYVNVPSGTGPIREEGPTSPPVIRKTAEYVPMSSVKSTYSMACCKCTCNAPVPDYVNISSIQPGSGAQGSPVTSSPLNIAACRSPAEPDYINIGPWQSTATDTYVTASVLNSRCTTSSGTIPSSVSLTNMKTSQTGTVSHCASAAQLSNFNNSSSQPGHKELINIPEPGESSTDIAYIARRHPNNTDDYMFITPGRTDRSATVSPSSDYLSSLPLSPRSVFSTSSGSTSPRPYASPDYMLIESDHKDNDMAIFCHVKPIRRVNSMLSPNEELSRQRKLSVCSSDSGQQSMSSYMEMKPSGRRRNPFMRSRSLKESTHHPRPQLLHSHSVDEELEPSTYILAPAGSPTSNSDYMCMTPPGDDDDDLNKTISSTLKPIMPFDNLIEPKHYVGAKNIPGKLIENSSETKNAPDIKPDQPKSLLSRLIRRNSAKDRKSILKTPDDSLVSPIESVPEVQEDKVILHASNSFPFAGDPFGLLGPSKDSVDARGVKQWPEECNLTDEEKQSYSEFPLDSPPSLPARKYKVSEGGMMKNDHTASSTTLQPEDSDDSTSQIYVPSDEEDEQEDLPPDLPEKTRIYSTIGRLEEGPYAVTKCRSMSSSSDNMLTDDLKSRSQTTSPRMTLPRSKRETRLTIFVPRTADMDDEVWLSKSAANTPDHGEGAMDGGTGVDADVSDTTSVCSCSSFSDTQSIYSDEANPRNTSVSQKPRYGLEYRRLDRRILEDETPNSPSVASSVFTFDTSRLSSVSTYSVGTHSPHSPCSHKDHDYINIGGGPRSFTDSPRFYIQTPPGSPRSLSGISEVSNPCLNYAEIDLTQTDESKRPRKPVSRASDIEYAELDMLATAAASRAGKEHAQLREDSLRRKDRRTPLEDGSKEYIQRRHRKTSSSQVKERKSSSSRSGSKDRKLTV